MSDLVLTAVDGSAATATLTLNRPETRNPASVAMLDALDGALDLVTADERVRVVILGGADSSFCSGLDLDEVRAGPATVRHLLERLSEVMRRIRRLPLATVARVEGAAIGGGFGFMVVTDFALTHPEAKIGYPPLASGLSPALMAPWLVRAIPAGRARSMLMAGGTISGQAAYDMGLVSHLAPRGDLPAAASRLAADLALAGPGAVRALKSFLNELDDSTADEVLDRAAAVSADVIASDETQERLTRMFGEDEDRENRRVRN